MTTPGIFDVVGVTSVVITSLDDDCFGTGVSGRACVRSSSGLGVALYFDVGGGLGDGPALGPGLVFEADLDSGGVIVFFLSRFLLADSRFVAVDLGCNKIFILYTYTLNHSTNQSMKLPILKYSLFFM
jgi:hypothetical protein